jgi:iron complex outermembrane receptor protein
MWLPQDNIEFKVIADYSDANEQCCDAVILAESPLALGGLYALAGLPGGAGVEAYGPQVLEERQTNGSGSYSDTQQFGLSTQLNWSSGWADFTGIMSYRGFEAAANLDLDYVSIDVANTMDPRNVNDIDT